MKRGILGLWLSLIGWFTLAPASLLAQYPPDAPPPIGPADGVKPMRPSAALQEGINSYINGKYEIAAAYFEQASQGKAQLSAAERGRLDEYSRRNTTDRQGRQQVVNMLRTCEELVQAGKGKEADSMLRTLKTSKYLTAEEQKRVNQMYETAHPKTSRSWNPFSRDPKTGPDTDAMMAEAKKALDQKDYDKAEMLAKEAKKAGHSSLMPWNDSPDDILKEVQKARVRSTTTDKPNAVPAANPDVLMTEARKAFERGELDRAESLANQAKGRGYSAVLLWSDTPDKVLKDVQAARAKQMANGQVKPTELTAAQKQAKDVCGRALQAVNGGDVATAKTLLKQAEDLKANLPWWEKPNPEEVRTAIGRAEQTMRTGNTVTGAKPDAVKPDLTTSAKPLQANEVRPAVKQARQLLEAKRLDDAEALAKRARLVTGVKYSLFEDTPDKIIADVQKLREDQNHDKAEELLTQSRQQLNQGNLAEAERLAYQAKALRNDYPIWHRGERPDRLLADIRLKKQQQAKITLPPRHGEQKPDNQVTGQKPLPADQAAKKREAQALLAEARQHISAGQLAAAVQLAGRVKMMGVAFAPGDDTPEQIVQAVQALQAQAHARENPQAAAAARQQALLLLSQARESHRQGQLLTALALAKQAQDCKAIFQQGDPTPEIVIVELQQLGRQHMETYGNAARTWRTMEKWKEAEQCLSYVRDLHVAFGMDTHAVSQQLAELQRLASGQPVAVKPPVGNEGERLLNEARLELKRGEILRAQKLARQVYEGPFGLRVEASQVLADIDEAQHRQSVKEANQFYDLGLRAFSRGDYNQAASYFQSINMRLLDERKRAHANEILASRQMQPHTLQQTQGTTPEIPARVTIEPVKPTNQQPTKPSVLTEVQARQEIELQRLRAMKLQSEGQANKLAQQGDFKGAIDTLKLALDQIRGAGLEHDQAVAMQRQLEEKMKQLGNLREQQAFEKLKRDTLSARNNKVEQRFLAEQSKKEQVAALLEQCNGFIKEAKYKEGEAVAMKAKEIDPDNPTVDAFLFKTKTLRSLNEDQKMLDRKAVGFEHTMRDTSASSVVPERDFNYDENFAERTKHRKGRTSHLVKPETREDRETKSKLTTKVSVDFRNKPLNDVLDHLRTLYGVNIVQDEPALQEEGLSTSQPVSISLSDVALKTALERILHNTRMTYVVRDGIVLVTTPKGKAGKLVQKVYPVADLVIPVENYGTVGVNNNPFLNSLQPNQSMPAISGAQPWANSGVPVSHSSSSSASTHPTPPNPTNPNQRPERPRGATIEDILIRLITDTIEPKSWDTSGGPSHIDYYPLGLQLVVSADPEIQEQVELLLNRLRELQELQVTVEVRFITLSEAFYERIGVDFDVEVDDDETRFEPLVVNGQFAPAGFINESDHLDNVVVGMQPAGAFTSDLDVPFRTSSFERAIPPFGNFPNSIGNNGGIDFGVAFLSDIEVFMFVEAAQGDTRTNVMQAPKITLFNGQTASLSVQDFQYLVNGIQLVPSANGQVSTLPQVTPFPSGLTLQLQAVVSADRRYVRLSLGPQFSSLSQNVPLFPFPLTFQPIIADDIAGPPVTITQFIQLPQISTLTVSTTVTVPDGGTILMGGFKTLSEGRTEFGPPILSKLPYINRLFRNVGYGREARTLLMMITPRIIIPEEEEERLAQTFAF